MTSVPGNPQPEPREELARLFDKADGSWGALDSDTETSLMVRTGYYRYADEVLAAGWRPPVQSDEEVIEKAARLLFEHSVNGSWEKEPAVFRDSYRKEARALAEAGLLATATPETRAYASCRYVLFEGEGGGCIANATTADGYCKPHADALRELGEASDA